MAEMTTPKHGEFCWRELTTQNTDKAKEFYRELLGWNIEKTTVTPMEYDRINLDGKDVGGIIRIDEQWGAGWENIPSHWMTYVAVDNCDETVEKVKENGGNVCVPPFEVPNVGRISVINDPSGAAFSIIQLTPA